MKTLLWFIAKTLKKIVESVLITFVLLYVVVVSDIYINTEKLSKVNYHLNVYCEDIARNPKFTKGPVVFRVDRGTLFFNIDSYVGNVDLWGYSPFFIFPHHRTVIFSEETLKRDKLAIAILVAHELGHIQGGLKHFGPVKEIERYADDFAEKVNKKEPED